MKTPAGNYIEEKIKFRESQIMEKNHITDVMRNYYILEFKDIIAPGQKLKHKEIIRGINEINLAVGLYNTLNSKVIRN